MRAAENVLNRILWNACCVLILFSAVSCGEDDPGSEDVRTQLHEEINELRTNGCTCGTQWMSPVKALEWNVILEQAASDHAADMYTNNYFDHISPNGKSPIDRAKDAGYSGDYTGEVIARKYYNANNVVAAWHQSESHCRALVDLGRSQ
jgi:uncharacterized protein YkwD